MQKKVSMVVFLLLCQADKLTAMNDKTVQTVTVEKQDVKIEQVGQTSEHELNLTSEINESQRKIRCLSKQVNILTLKTNQNSPFMEIIGANKKTEELISRLADEIAQPDLSRERYLNRQLFRAAALQLICSCFCFPWYQVFEALLRRQS